MRRQRRLRSASSTSASEGTKRVLDVAGAALLLVLLAIPIALIALAIKIDSRGPAFYRCTRVGHRGSALAMWKFRKMIDGAGGPPLTQPMDPRFTRMGRFLAKSKLDELPQLWNVLTGEMSLVGPRPEDPEFVALYSTEYEQILRVKPGLTGLCQLAFARESELLDGEDTVGSYVEHLLPAKVSMDVLYAELRSLAMDCWLLAWTVVAVVLRRDVAVSRTSGRISLRSPRVATDYAPAEQDEVGTQGIVAAPVPAAQATD